jgi:hypothetical protein
MRAIVAAEAELDAGALDTAYKLLATAEMGQLDDLQRATQERLRARLASSLAPAATLHRCCSMRPDASYPSTPEWRVRPTSMRSAQRSSPGGSTVAVLHNGLGRCDSAFAAAQRHANMMIWAYSAGR